MESAIPMLLFFGGLTLFGLLIIWASYQSREIERAQQDAVEQEGQAAMSGSHFFSASEDPANCNAASDPALLGRFEKFLSEQQDHASHFVNHPTVDVLFHRLETELFPKLIDRIEAFLRHEQIAAGDFLSDPTIESLHRRRPVILAA